MIFPGIRASALRLASIPDVQAALEKALSGLVHEDLIVAVDKIDFGATSDSARFELSAFVPAELA